MQWHKGTPKPVTTMKCGCDASWHQEWCIFSCRNHSLEHHITAEPWISQLLSNSHNLSLSVLHIGVWATHTNISFSMFWFLLKKKSRCESQMKTIIRKLEDWDMALSGNLQLPVLFHSLIQIKGQHRENEKYSKWMMCLSIVFPITANEFIDYEKEGREARWER